MRINHNLTAMNAHRNLGISSASAGKSQEKLSSGLRIGRAADDAAGLAISEAMRGQIRGLDQASRNSQDAISLIQTAEGALTETHSILHRMRELSVQASNDTLIANDRKEIQKEVDQLKSEIDRIANTTTFNNKTLLDGSASALVSTDNATTEVYMRGAVTNTGNYRVNIKVATGGDTQIQVSNTFTNKNTGLTATANITLRDVAQFYDASGKFMLDNPQTITLIEGDGRNASFTISANDTLQDVATKFNNAILNQNGLNQDAITGVTGAVANELTTFTTALAVVASTSEAVNGTFVLRTAKAGPDGTISMVADQGLINAFGFNEFQSATTTEFTVNIYNASTGVQVVNNATVQGNELLGLLDRNVDLKYDANAGASATVVSGRFDVRTATVGSFNTFVHIVDNAQVFQIGANELQNMNAAIGNMKSDSLGVDNILVTDLSNAGKAITKLDLAISRVSAQRSTLGAVQNRLEHTINNLGVASENLTSAESRIRDVDMAKEMMEFTRLNILSQASTAMLAQANQQPQQVLQLLGR